MDIYSCFLDVFTAVVGFIHLLKNIGCHLEIKHYFLVSTSQL